MRAIPCASRRSRSQRMAARGAAAAGRRPVIIVDGPRRPVGVTQQRHPALQAAADGPGPGHGAHHLVADGVRRRERRHLGRWTARGARRPLDLVVPSIRNGLVHGCPLQLASARTGRAAVGSSRRWWWSFSRAAPPAAGQRLCRWMVFFPRAPGIASAVGAAHRVRSVAFIQRRVLKSSADELHAAAVIDKCAAFVNKYRADENGPLP